MWQAIRYTMYDETVIGEYPSATEAWYQAAKQNTWTNGVWYGIRKKPRLE